MNKFISLLLFLPLIVFNQNNKPNLDENVNGLLSTEKGVYLILNDGYIQIKKHDPYEEYYRKIYNDSTIINPNTELKTEFEFDIIPILQLANQKSEQIDFSESLNLSYFIRINESNKFNLTTIAQSKIDSMLYK